MVTLAIIHFDQICCGLRNLNKYLLIIMVTLAIINIFGFRNLNRIFITIMVTLEIFKLTKYLRASRPKYNIYYNNGHTSNYKFWPNMLRASPPNKYLLIMVTLAILFNSGFRNLNKYLLNNGHTSNDKFWPNIFAT